MGSAWYYVLASAIYRGIEPPYLIGGIALFWGYLRALLTRHQRYDNPAYQRYIRRFERAQLLRGKQRALAEENDRVRNAAAEQGSLANANG